MINVNLNRSINNNITALDMHIDIYVCINHILVQFYAFYMALRTTRDLVYIENGHINFIAVY